MKPTLPIIRQFDLTPLAKAGLFVKNIRGTFGQSEHDLVSPHRDDHYLLMLATQGELVINIDFNQLTVVAPALSLIAPGQVHYLVAEQQVQGWAIGFDPSLIEGEFEQVLARLLRSWVVVSPEPTFLSRSTALLQLLDQVQSGTPDPYTNRTLHTLLLALLSLLAGQLTGTQPPTKTKERRAIIIEQAFHHLLEQHYASWKQPAQYANALAITVSHLNDVVRTMTGQSPSTRIQERSLLEAKRLLYFTDLTVKEVGYAVGYDEPVYFNKLFRKRTGQTPLDFRRQFRD